MRKRLILLALVCLALAFGLFTPAYAENGYTVEFTRDGLEYVLPGDTSVAMSEILSTLGLTGEVDTVEVSNPGLFSASNATGEWVVTAHQAFSTTEWMKVVLNGVSYEIAVTDAELVSVPYIRRGWDESSYTVTESTETASATPVTSTSTTWGTDGGEAWYVVNSDVEMSNRVTVKGTVNLILCDGCTMTFNKTLYINNIAQGIAVLENNTLNIYGQSGDSGRVTIYSYGSSATAGIGGGRSCGTINIYGGTITTRGSYAGYRPQIGGAGIGGGYMGNGGQITIYGGVVDAAGQYAAGIGGGSYGSGGTITIYGGDVTASSNGSSANAGGAGIGGGNGKSPDPGTQATETNSIKGGDSGTIIIKGGTVTATGNMGGAGIGSGCNGLNADVKIYGGSVTATAKGGGAGIGCGKTADISGWDSKCTIEIGKNANVTVIDGDLGVGGGAAGIGSGRGTDKAGGEYNITINGNARVTATGTKDSVGGGAGIGGGALSRGGTINISGGTVTATGSYGGAGIGSGYNGKNATTITIEGGAITAEGSRYGSYSSVYKYSASIGLGASDENVSGNRIELNGGYITTEEYGIGNYEENSKSPEICINLQKDTDAIINEGNYYGKFIIAEGCSLLNAEKNNEPVTSAPTGPSKLILGGKTRYRIKNYTDKDGTVTAWKDGFAYNNPAAGDVVDIVVTPGAGYRYVENSVSVTGDDNNTVTVTNQQFVMPSQNVTLRAQFEKIPITYIDPEGETIKDSINYTPISSDLTTWSGASTPKVFAVIGNVTIDTRVTVSSKATLVLTDGATLTIPKGIEVKSGATLNICTYSTEADAMGSLVITSPDNSNAGIGGTNSNAGTITIYGGKISTKGGYAAAGIGGGYRSGGKTTINGGIVTATGGHNGAGIGGGGNYGAGGTITVNGGTVTAIGGSYGAGIGGGYYGGGGTITVNGGIVTATGGSYGAGIGGGSNGAGGKININGGKVEATGGVNATGIGNGNGNTGTSNLTVGFSSDDDSLKASSYTALTVENGKSLADSEKASSYTGTLDADALTAIKNRTLVKAYTISVNVNAEGGTVTPSAGAAPKNRRVTLDVSLADGYGLQTLSYQVAGSSDSVDIVKDNDGKYSFEMPQGNVTVTATFALHVHHFTYTADGSTIKAACTDGCDITTGLTLTISTPTDLTYNGQNKAATLNTGYNTTAFPETNETNIVYTKGGEAFVGTPTDAGEYAASVTVGEGNGAATARVEYVIAKAEGGISYAEGSLTKTFGDAAFINALTRTGDGTVSYGTNKTDVATVNSETGEVTIVGAGEATITATVTDGDNYTYATKTASYTITVNPAIMTVSAEGYTGIYDGQPHSITVTVTKPASGATIIYGTSEETYDLTTNPAITNVNDSKTVYFKVTAPNYTVYTGSAAVTLSKASQTAPAAPTKASATINSITLTAITNGEYKMGDGNWQTSPTFTGLTMNKSYTFRQRYAADENHNVSVGSDDTVIRTNNHSHEWGYEAQGATITATCGNTDGGHGTPLTATMTINAPARTVYGGSESAEATITGSIDGVTNPDIVYKKGSETLNAAPVHAGTYTASITLGEGEGAKTASVEYEIARRALTIDIATATDRAYVKDNTAVTISGVTFKDSSEQAVALTLGEEGDYTVTGAMSDANAGGAKTVNVTVTLKNANYSLATNTTTTTVNISKAAAQTIADVTDSQVYTVTSVSASAAGKMPADAGELTYTAGTASATGSVTVSGFAVDNSGNVTAALSGGTANDIVTLPVTISSTNYADSTVNVKITLTAKGTQTITADDVTVTYGDTDKKINATTDGDGAISYAVKDGSGDYIDVDATTGMLTIKKVPADGKAYVVVTAAETQTCAQATKEVTVTINKTNAVPATVVANNRTYDGTEKPLVTEDKSTLAGGEMWYALSENAATAPADNLYTTSIPTATDAGTYYVWYKVVGDDDHNDTQPECVTTTIKIYKFTVSYDANGGTNAPAAQTKEYGVTLRLSTQKPSRADYVHSYVTTLIPNGGKLEGESTLHSAQTTVYTFQNWNSSPVGSNTSYAPGASYTENASVTLYAQWTSVSTRSKVMLPVPVREGYTFKGWNIHADAERGAMGEYEPTGTRTLYATWKLKQSTITFDTDGGTEIAPITQDYGTAITAPADPTREGYTFAGWNKAIPTTMPAEDMTIKASWTVKRYTITFDTDGGTEIAPITQDYGTAITAPADPTRTGYTFAGWDKTIPATMPAEDMTIKASWTINRYTITFDTAGGSEIAPITQDYGTAITAPADPTRTGYTFAGWDKTIPATMPAEDMTIKASWTINRYTITFDTAGGTEIAPITQDYGTAITAPADPTREGYTFAGWDKAIPVTMPAEDMTIKASWTINQYTITFDTDGGTEIAPITQDYGTAITAPADPTREGYTFAGWNKPIPATMPAEDMTIKASWTINRYTITFDTDGGTEIAPITQDYGTAIKAPADPTREGYTFAGWNKPIPATMPAEDMTIKASWTVNQYTITFDTDGGTKIAPITQDYGTAIKAPADPTKPWYSFLGWEPALPETMPAQNLTVKAVFKLAVPRITGADLVLSGTLDFRFYVELPENFDPTGAYMSFDIHSKLARSYTRDFDESVEIDGKKVYTCPVYSIEMAEPVDAVFHYGTDGKATLTVSIRDYLDKLEEQQGKAKIIDAVRNYGHYMQPYLSGVHGFTVGEGEGYDYQSMPAAGDITPLTELDAYKRVWGENGYDDSVLKSMGYYDSFNESIRLNIRLRFKDVPGNVTATVDGRAGDVRKLSSKTYQVEIPDIAANKLGKFWHVIVTADGRIVYDVHISALSYVSSLLALNRDQAGEREALTALYEYYEAAKAYKGN